MNFLQIDNNVILDIVPCDCVSNLIIAGTSHVGQGPKGDLVEVLLLIDSHTDARSLSLLKARLPRAFAAYQRGEQLLTQCKALVYYAQLIVMPTHLNVEHQFAVSTSLWGAPLLAVLFLVSVAAVVVRCRQSKWLFWMGWILVALLPTLVVPLNVLVNEHRLYMPMAALALAAGCAWPSLGDGKSNRIIYVLLALCALLIYQRNKVWSDELSL